MEIINSFFSNIKDKLTNPFFGTLILVLVIHHWELWYVVFNFDDSFKLGDKLIFIKEYIELNITIKSLFFNIIFAFFFMILGYLIIILTRSLVLWIEFGLMPFITGKIINKNVVKKSLYDEVVNERETYFDQYEEQRKNVRNFSKTIDQQTEQIKKKDTDYIAQNETLSKFMNELNETKKKLDKSVFHNENIDKKNIELTEAKNLLQKLYENKLECIKQYEDVYFAKGNQKFYSFKNNFPPTVIEKVDELWADNKWGSFLDLAKFYTSGGSIGQDEIDEMIKRGLLFENVSGEELSPLGSIIWKYQDAFKKEGFSFY